MKSIIKFFTTLFLLGLMPTQVSALTFPDMPSDQTLSLPIQELTDKGIINGFEDGRFRPNQAVTWGEWVKLVYASRDIARDIILSSQVDPSVTNAADRASREGYIASNQALNGPIPRVEAIMLLAGAYGLTPPFGFQGTSGFVDIPSDSDSQFAYLISLGLIRGIDSTHLGTHPLLRQEAAKLIRNSMPFANVASELVVSSPGMRLLGLSQTTLSPGDTLTVLFIVQDANGDTIPGYVSTDFRLVVLQGSLTETGFSELGSGVYQYTLKVNDMGPPGEIKLRIHNLRSVANSYLEIPDNTTTAESQIGVTVSPKTLLQGQKANIVAVPRSAISGSPVSGLTLTATVVAGSGMISTDMTENPIGSGIYVGEFTSTGIGPATIRVTIDSAVTRPYADVTVTQI